MIQPHTPADRPMRAAIVLTLALGLGAASATLADPLTPPPDSLAAWYKPANERQVWLHVMFELRRSAQAIEEYAVVGDRDRLAKWGKSFAEAYRKVPEMVPEWADEVDLGQLERLEQAIAADDHGEIDSALQRLQTTCRSCHNDHRATVAALLRGPDFRNLVIPQADGERPSYAEAMEVLSLEVNRIKIGADDGRWGAAADAAGRLTDRLGALEQGCSGCHRDDYPRERILGAPTDQALAELQQTLSGQDLKGTNRLLGQIGYTVCARCHSIHKSVSDLGGLIRKRGNQ